VQRSPTVIAIEGPSDSGKSTLAQELAAFANWQPAGFLPCYVDLVPPDCLPAGIGGSLEEQLKGLEFFASLDHRRQEQVATEAATVRTFVADRSWLSVLAHTYAVERSGGPAAYARARERLLQDDCLLQPDMVLVLQASDATRAARIGPADRGAWFTNRSFNAHFNQFFAEEAPLLVPRLAIVDANRSAADVAAAALAVLAEAGMVP
jgi:thymidylate kinase